MPARPRALARSLSLLLALVAVLAGLATVTASPAAAAGSGALSGVYPGGVKTDKAQAFADWRGRPLAVASDFLPGDSWAEVEGPSWLLGAWAGRVDRLVLGVPILPGAKGSTSFAAGIAGDYDQHFTALARNLVAAGHDDAVLRLGWEMNGNWYPWSIIGQEAQFASYFRRIVTTMRAVTGARFAFEFNPTLHAGSHGAKPDAAWPGDEYVDVIGLDVYDSIWGNSTATPAARWAFVQGGAYGLDWWASFAKAHGDKPLGFPEWGLWETAGQNGGGGGDNPLFITSFLRWVDTHHVLYETYFNVTAQDGDHLISNFPNAAAAYKAHFSGATAAVLTPVAQAAAPVAATVPAPVAATAAKAAATTATPATAPTAAAPATAPTAVAKAPAAATTAPAARPAAVQPAPAPVTAPGRAAATAPVAPRTPPVAAAVSTRPVLGPYLPKVGPVAGSVAPTRTRLTPVRATVSAGASARTAGKVVRSRTPLRLTRSR